MAMTANEPMPKWRNVLRWAAVGFVLCGFVMLGAIALLQDGGVGGLFDSGAAVERKAVSLAAALLLGTAIIAFSQRNVPFGPRALRNFVLLNVLGLALLALGAWGFRALAGTVALDASATVALVLGLVLIALAILCSLLVAAAHSRAGFLTDEQLEDIRERARVTVYSSIWLAAVGLMLVLLSLAGPGGAVSPTIALAGSIGLLVIAAAVTLAMWSLLDELWRVLSRETGNAGFYLIVAIGGGWAILAHLGFVRAPTPLDWLTMLTVIMFAASLLTIGRRGLLEAR